MKQIILPLLALIVVSLTACEKDEEGSKPAGKEVLMAHDWKYQDVLVEQDLSYTVMGMKVDFDTTYSPFKDTPPCQLDFAVQFLANDKLGYTSADSYCGGDLSQSSNALWKLDEARSELTLIGYGVAGILSQGGSGLSSLGDTAVYKIVELTDKTFVFEYVMDEAALSEALDMGEFGDQFEFEIEGTSKIKVTMVSQ